MQLCEYGNQTLEAFVVASRLYAKFDCPVARQKFSLLVTANVAYRVGKIPLIFLSCLRSQFQKYYESDDDLTPPVKLEPCLTASGGQIVLSEPLVSTDLLQVRRFYLTHDQT